MRWMKLTDHTGNPVYVNGQFIVAACDHPDGGTQIILTNGGIPRVREGIEHIISASQQ